MRTVTTWILGIALIHHSVAQEDSGSHVSVSGTGHVSFKAKTRHVFIFFITPKYFNWSETHQGDSGNRQRSKDVGFLR